MTRPRPGRTAPALVALAVTAALLAGGCGDDGDDAAAPPTTGAPAQTAATAPAAAGDVAGGRTVFSQSCAGCHADLGNRAAVGPKLAGAGLSEDTIRTTVEEGSGVMPAGLVAGRDLDDVVAYVASLQ